MRSTGQLVPKTTRAGVKASIEASTQGFRLSTVQR
jgi:hypothetical protein